MTLIIETGTGNPDATAYADLATYNTYAAAYYGDAAITDENPIRRAVAYMEGLRWRGSRANGRDQGLAWPRLDMKDCDHNAISSTEIPRELIQAQHELTRAEALAPGILSPQASMRDAVKTMEKVDVIQVGYDVSRLTPDAVRNAEVIVEAAMRHIRCFVAYGGRMTDARVV